MRIPTRRLVEVRRAKSPSEGEWNRWFAWYPVLIATGENLAHWVWLEFVERKWRTSRYGSKRKRRYRLPQKSKTGVPERLHNLAELTRKLDAALNRSRQA